MFAEALPPGEQAVYWAANFMYLPRTSCIALNSTIRTADLAEMLADVQVTS